MNIRHKFSPRVSVIAMEGESLTQQHFKEAVDINNILAKYRKTGIIEHVRRAKETYGDLRDLADYAKDLDKVAKAQQAFEMLPAELRNQFQNSIPGFFDYITKAENFDQCVKWGIYEAPKEPAAVTPAAAKPAEPAPQAKKDGSMKTPKTIPTNTGEGG